MVAGREHHVFHSRRLGGGHPGLRIEVRRFELIGQLGVLLHGDLFVPLHPFPPSGDGENAPVKKQAKSRLPPGGHARLTLLGRFGE